MSRFVAEGALSAADGLWKRRGPLPRQQDGVILAARRGRPQVSAAHGQQAAKGRGVRQHHGRRDRRRRGAITIVVIAMLVLLLTAGGTGAAPPGPAFIAFPAPARVGAPVTFAANVPGLATGTMTWDFGDGATATGGPEVLTVRHTYQTPGTRTVTLTVTRAGEDPQVAAATLDVHDPLAAFTTSTDTPNVGEAVAFDASASSDPPDGFSDYAWDFGDGATASGVMASHTYTAAGQHTVTLTTTSAADGRTTTATRTLRVNALPVAGFTVAPASPRTGDTIMLTSTATDPDGAADLASIAWDIDGDGVFADAEGSSARAAFLTAGDYTIGQRVVDHNGAAATAFATVAVTGAPASMPPSDPPPAGDGPTVVVVPAVGEPALPPGSADPGSTPGTTTTTGAGSGGARRLRVLKVRVRMAGSVTGDLTTLTSISVVGPKGVTFRVRCAGRGCPAKPLRVRLTRAGAKRLRGLQRTFRTGTRVTVDATKKGYLPKRVVLTFRRGVPPSRKEQCLYPTARKGKTRAAACPAR